jgi:hypothetical protein
MPRLSANPASFAPLLRPRGLQDACGSDSRDHATPTEFACAAIALVGAIAGMAEKVCAIRLAPGEAGGGGAWQAGTSACVSASPDRVLGPVRKRLARAYRKQLQQLEFLRHH